MEKSGLVERADWWDERWAVGAIYGCHLWVKKEAGWKGRRADDDAGVAIKCLNFYPNGFVFSRFILSFFSIILEWERYKIKFTFMCRVRQNLFFVSFSLII